MLQFKKGDRVRYVGIRPKEWSGRAGTVMAKPAVHGYKVRVRFDGLPVPVMVIKGQLRPVHIQAPATVENTVTDERFQAALRKLEKPTAFAIYGLSADDFVLLLNTLQDGYDIALEAWKQDHGRKKDALAIKRLAGKIRRGKVAL